MRRLIASILACCCLIFVPSLISAVPFMPRFPDTDSSRPVARQSFPGSGGITWIVGSSDKVGYIDDACQNLTIRVAPEYLPLPANNSTIGFEFQCLGGNNLPAVNHTWLISMYDNSSATNNETAVCLGIERAGLQLIQLNGTDFQLRSTHCRLKESRKTTSTIHKLSIRVFVSQSNGSALLRSKRLTVWYPNRFAEQFVGPTDVGKLPLISKAAIGQIERAIDFDITLWRFPFLEKATLQIINGLPLYLKGRINVGVIITAADCRNVSLNESVVISTNRYASWYRTAGTANSTTAERISLADLHYIDLKSGFLASSNANLMSEYMSVWPRLPTQLTICEFIQFSGHSAAPYSYLKEVSKFRIEQAALMLPSPEGTCSPAFASSPAAEVPLVEVLEDSGSSAIQFPCPLVCSVARNVTCRPVSCMPPTNSSVHVLNATCRYTCSAEVDTFTIDIKASSLTRFLSSSNASLPARVFAMEGESVSYSCSAIVSASDYQRNRSGTIWTTIHAPQQAAGEKTRVSKRVWTNLQPAAFSAAVTLKTTVNQAGESKAGVVETVTVTVRQVPQANDGGNFTHRFTCQLAADPDEANRLYGMPDYASEVGADVVFVPRPTDDSFRVEAINDTSFRFQLHPVFAAYLAETGAQLRAAFRLGDRWLNASHPMVKAKLLAAEFQPTSASLTLTVVPLSSSTSSALRRRRLRRQVTGPPPGERSIMAVFSFRYPDGARLGSLRKAPTNRTATSRLLGSGECTADPSCFYTTDYDIGEASQLQQTLTINLDDANR